MTNYGLTEDGKFALEAICEDGRTELGGAIIGDGRIVPIYMLFSEETGAGADALGSRLFNLSDVGEGVDVSSELLAALSESDEGVGKDTWTAILAEVEQSDTGLGVEGRILFVYILLKLLQEKGVSIELSQELKGLNMKLSQERNPN